MRGLLLLVALGLLVAAVRVWRVDGRRPRPPQSPAEPEAWDPWAVLGVRRGASRDEIHRAYREQMKRYHPDRVDDLGEELRAAAHAKVLAIGRAYRELGGS